MDKVQKHNSFNTNTPSSESYRNYHRLIIWVNKVTSSSLDCTSLAISCNFPFVLSVEQNHSYFYIVASLNTDSPRQCTQTVSVTNKKNIVNWEFFSSPPALGPTQAPIQRVPGALSLRVNRPGREADHSHPLNSEVKNA
jgi:hypothetical protein